MKRNSSLSLASFLMLINLLTPWLIHGQVWQEFGGVINGSVNNLSGGAIGLSADGQRIAVASLFFNNTAGKVDVFELTSGTWSKLGPSIAGNANAAQMGQSLDISADGSILIIGNRCNESGLATGCAQIFKWTPFTWTRLATFTVDSMHDTFGESVGISAGGDTVVIGGGRRSNLVNSSKGRVRVYYNNGTSWVQLGSDISGTQNGGSFGAAVAISRDGSTLIAGAPLNNSNANLAGKVRVYQWDGTDWVQKGNDIDGAMSDAYFGYSVDIANGGQVIAVGAPRNDIALRKNIGQVKVFTWNGASWVQRGQSLDGEEAEDQSGVAIALNHDGTSIAIGAAGNDANGNLSGHVRVYNWFLSGWYQVGTDIDGLDSNSESGAAVAFDDSGTILAIGAPKNNLGGHYSGSVKTYRQSAVGIEDKFHSGLVEIYPNPAGSRVKIISPQEHSVSNVALLNLQGRVLDQVSKDDELNLEEYPEGCYFLRIRINSETIMKPLVIQR